MLNNFKELYKAAYKVITAIPEVNIDERMATNYAIMAAGYTVVYGEGPETMNFPRIMMELVTRVYKDESQEEESLSFWDDILTMKETGDMRGNMWRIISGEVPRAIFNFRALYAQWEMWSTRKRREVPFTARAIKNIIRNESYCVSVDSQRRVGDSRPKGCIEIDLSMAPDAIQELCEDSEEIKEEKQ